MLTCRDVANYFLARVDDEAGDSISNLKLQKLVYYAQGFHLAIHGEPLFLEAIEAWAYGPAVPVLYRSFKQHGAEPIRLEEPIDLGKYDPATRELLDEVFSVYGQFTATKLCNLTHNEQPWKETPQGQVIPHELMREYFSTLVTQ